MAEKKTHQKTSTSLFKRLFFNRNKETDLLVEEQIQSPSRMMFNNFLHNRMGMIGLIVFVIIMLFVTIGPNFVTLNLGDSDATQANIGPVNTLMSVPSSLNGKIADISVGPTFSIGLDTEGKVYTWGYTKITSKINIKNVPDNVKKADIKLVAAGYDHAVAVDKDDMVYVWGNSRLGQDQIPYELTSTHRIGPGSGEIIQLEAAYQFSAVVTDDGYLYLWGNTNMNDIYIKGDIQGHVKKVALSRNNYIVLLDDGSVQYAGYKSSTLSAIPESLGNDVVDIAASGETMAALTSDGKLVVWGGGSHGEKNIPEFTSTPKEIYGGLFHYTALLEDGSVVGWGSNTNNQINVPSNIKDQHVTKIFSGFYQNYALTEKGKVITWGLKGHPLGTDDLGRDIMTRIIHGGKTTMTVGAIAEIIALIVGVVLGALSGFFGGKLDIIIMRITEIIGALPFLPFALLLSAIIGTRFSVTMRMYLIMVVLGLLSWTGICRLIRAQILSEREKEYVLAAKAMGVKENKIIFSHILPNVLSILLVEATLGFATCMLTESSLSYLGFGITPPTPTWGNMLTGANNSIVIQQYWWRWVFPATIFGVCTICINLIGDAIREAVDPKSLGR